MDDFGDWIERTTGLGGDHVGDIVATVIVVVALSILRRVFLRITARRISRADAAYRWRKLSGSVTFLLGTLAVVAIWFDAFRSVSTFLGLLSAGLAIALRDPIVNLAGWIFIVWRAPFEAGDRIQIGGHAGDVVDVRAFQFSLMETGGWVDADQPTGRIVHVSNGKVFTDPVANYSKPFPYIWNEIPILVTFESDWEKAKGLLEAIARERADTISASAEPHVLAATRRYLLPGSELPPSVFTSVVDSGVLLTVRYLCEPRRRRATAQAIWEDVLREFARHDDIDFAYPTQRFFNNVVEGAEGARATDPSAKGEEQRLA